MEFRGVVWELGLGKIGRGRFVSDCWTAHDLRPSPAHQLTLYPPHTHLSSLQVRQAAERGVASAGFGAAAFMKPLLQNLCLSLGDNEELCYCLKTWQVSSHLPHLLALHMWRGFPSTTVRTQSLPTQ